MVIDLVAGTLLVAGMVFLAGAVVGLVRFPDFYTRSHAATKGDTLSSVLLLSGLALYNLHHLDLEHLLASIKVLFILGFFFVASPTGGHALVDAGYSAKQPPWTREGEEERA